MTAVPRREMAWPPHLRPTADILLELMEQLGCSVAVTGALARGEWDRYSDLDLLVVTDSGEARRITGETIARHHEVLAAFTAEYLGLHNLDVYCLWTGLGMVKVDIEWRSREAAMTRAWSGLALIDPARALGQATAPDRADVAGLFDRVDEAAGWIWYVVSRARRGELLAAERALRQMVERTLLPALLLEAGQPLEDYRRIERRLPAAALADVHASLPAGRSEPEIQRAALHAGQRFAEALARVDRESPRVLSAAARIRRMRACVESSQGDRTR
jgi:hypothetical protein